MNDLEKQLLNEFQRDFPLSARPFAVIAKRLGVSEKAVLQTLKTLQENGAVSRVGPVFAPRQAGVSTLAAMAVAPAELETIAALVNGYSEVNHNYEREHYFNLWFVITAPDQDRLDELIRAIEHRSGLPVMILPLLREYHIDLAFKMDLA